jgi:hypothetical protein
VKINYDHELKRYLCTTYDNEQFITYSIKQEIAWLEKGGIKFPALATGLLANKQTWIPEFSFAYGISWHTVDNWVAVKEAVEV